MNNVIPMHTTRAAKIRGVAAYAYFAARARGLSPIQCEDIMRHARRGIGARRKCLREVWDDRHRA